MSVLELGAQEGAKLLPATRNAITAASQMGADVHVLIADADADVQRAAGAASLVSEVTTVLVASAAHFARPTAESVAAQLLAVIAAGTYSHVVAAATGFGKSVMPRVAAKLDVAQISEIISVESPDTFVRPIYAGNALATIRSSDAIKVVTIRATAFTAAPDNGGSAEIRAVAVVPDPGASVVTGQELTQSDRPELTGARVVISGGRGLGSAENFKMLEPLAAKLNAALGASRAAVDAGYVPNDYQVGQTGKIVAPDLYIAVGISGAIQHLAGMKDSKVIVAINKDPDAPIFQIADYGLVGDLFEVIPQLTAALS